MMKRLITMLLAALLALSCPALAEESGAALAPEVRIFEYVQDTGVDVAAFIAAAPGPETRESIYDEQDNELYAIWLADGTVLSELYVTFAEPLDGFWTTMELDFDNGRIWLNVLGDDGSWCYATYSAEGALFTYGYGGPQGDTVSFNAADTKAQREHPEEAPDTALEIIPASRDYSGDDLLGVDLALTRVIYGALADVPLDLSAHIAAAMSPPEVTEEEGVFTVTGEGYYLFSLYAVNYATDERTFIDADRHGTTWTLDASGLDASAYDVVTISLTGEDDARAYTYGYQWSYPDWVCGYIVKFAVADEHGYDDFEIDHDGDGNVRYRLAGRHAYAYYDAEGRLTRYAYSLEDNTVTVTYDAEGQLLRISPQEADPALYPPLPII